MAKKPVSKKAYARFNHSRRFALGNADCTKFTAGFLKVFHECQGLIPVEHVERIKYLNKKYGEKEARDYIETELIDGMEVAE